MREMQGGPLGVFTAAILLHYFASYCSWSLLITFLLCARESWRILAWLVFYDVISFDSQHWYLTCLVSILWCHLVRLATLVSCLVSILWCHLVRLATASLQLLMPYPSQFRRNHIVLRWSLIRRLILLAHPLLSSKISRLLPFWQLLFKQ